MSDPMPTDELTRMLKRTEFQHRASSIPGREIVQVLTEIPAGVESGWHPDPIARLFRFDERFYRLRRK